MLARPRFTWTEKDLARDSEFHSSKPTGTSRLSTAYSNPTCTFVHFCIRPGALGRLSGYVVNHRLFETPLTPVQQGENCQMIEFVKIISCARPTRIISPSSCRTSSLFHTSVRPCLAHHSSQAARIQSFATRGRPRRLPTVVSTLHPERLTSNDFLDVSGLGRKYVSMNGGRTDLRNRHDRLTNYVPFPPGSHGFLYYYTDPSLPDVAGEVRFRLTANNDPSNFDRGRDFLRPHGLPWAISLLNISRVKYREALKRQLQEDGLVDPGVMQRCERLFKNSTWNIAPHIILYSLHQPFVVDLGATSFDVGVVTDDSESIHRCTIRAVFRVDRRRPYTGMFHLMKCSHPSPMSDSGFSSGHALVRFERSPLPQHAERDILVLRVLKILTPMGGEDQHLLPPEEGSLLQTRRSLRVIHLDSPASGALRLLLRA